MNKITRLHSRVFVQAFLWATAIIISAMFGSSPMASVILLPSLAVCALTALTEEQHC